MARFFCPGCWKDFAEDFDRCPSCGLEIKSSWDTKDYVAKLIAALNHPEPTTPVRAAYLLGLIGESRAVEPLIEVATKTPDVFLAREAIKALGSIGTNEARVFLESLVAHPARLIRHAAREALGEIEAPKDKHCGDLPGGRSDES